MDATDIPAEKSESPSNDHGRSRRWFSVIAYIAALLVWPAFAFLRAPLDPLDFAWQVESDRLGTYTASMIFLWTAFAIVWLIQRIDRQRFHHIGFTIPRSRDFLFAIAFLVGAYPLLGALAWGLDAVGLAIPELVIHALLPVTSLEKITWILLSITAAVCEESVFRGYLLVRGEELLKSRALALALSAAAFGIGHYYQGWGGVILISVYGLMFTWLRFRTGSLWACIAAHALQDMISGYIGSLQNG